MGALYRLNQLARIAQQIAALGEGLLLPSLQSGPLQLGNLELQTVNAPGFLRLVHLESRNLPAQDRKAAKGRPVFLLQRSRFSESIQILQVLLPPPAEELQVAPLVQELLAVVLPVDIEELPAQLP